MPEPYQNQPATVPQQPEAASPLKKSTPVIVALIAIVALVPLNYFSGKLARPEGDIYVSLHVAPGAANLDIIETKPMEGGLVTVNAAALKGDIGKTGHAAVYGIYFDTAKADIKQESAPALQEIGNLLQQDPQLKLYIVGHTDGVGELQMNMDLSRQRADAVVKALITTYGVASGRLQAFGNGPLAPVASNRDEAGRAKNRRVELVER